MPARRLYAVTIVFSSADPSLPLLPVQNAINNVRDFAQHLVAQGHLFAVGKSPYENVLKVSYCTSVLIDDALEEVSMLLHPFIPECLKAKFMIGEQVLPDLAPQQKKQMFELPKHESTPHLPPVC